MKRNVILGLGRNLKSIRERMLLSQETAEELTGIERAQISKIEGGYVNVTINTLTKFKEAYDVTFAQIFDFKYLQKDVEGFPFFNSIDFAIYDLIEYLPKRVNNYYEPFYNGSLLMYALNPKKIYLNSAKSEIIDLFKTLKDKEATIKLIKDLETDSSHLKIFNKESANLSNLEEINNYLTRKEAVLEFNDLDDLVKNFEKDDFVFLAPEFPLLINAQTREEFTAQKDLDKTMRKMVKMIKKISSKKVNICVITTNPIFGAELVDNFHTGFIKVSKEVESLYGEIFIFTNYEQDFL